jgi:predicted esterase
VSGLGDSTAADTSPYSTLAECRADEASLSWVRVACERSAKASFDARERGIRSASKGVFIVKSILWSLLAALSQTALLAAAPEQAGRVTTGGKYTLVVEGYDWGAGVSKAILTLDGSVSKASADAYAVFVERRTDCMELPPAQAAGERLVVDAYVSDAQGHRLTEGNHVTLVLGVAPQWPITSPLQYLRNDKCRGNQWVDYALTVVDKTSGRVWNTPDGRIVPLVDRYDLSGRFVSDSGVKLSYAWYEPKARSGKAPLLIWLHGGGEGGTDPSIPLLANRAANYASDEIQAIFDGAYVLVPQCPGAWMDNREGVMTHGKEDDVYNAALMALIREFVSTHPGIDTSRIYVGGCSNGGYMSLKLLLLHPDYFAAGFISSLAYQSQYLSDAQIRSIASLPIWFVQTADDKTTLPDETVLPVYKRLKAVGATNVHLSYYEHAVDITGLFGGDDYRYNGHWSWIYVHANRCRLDFDGKPVTVQGRPVTIMEWLAAQTRAEKKGKR